MPKREALYKAQRMAEEAAIQAEEYSGFLAEAKTYIVSTFGPNGLVAAFIILGVLGLLLVMKLTKLTFAALKFLVIPSLVLALVGTIVLPYSFITLLPLTASVCSLGLLFKG